MVTAPDSAAALRDRVHADPESVLAEAHRLLTPEPNDRSLTAELRWALGLAHRELGDLVASRSELAAASALALSDGNDRLNGQVAVSRSIVEMSLGEVEVPHQLLDDSESYLDGADLGRLVAQRGLLFHRSGELELAIDSYRRAVPLIEQDDDHIARIRLDLNLGLLLGQRGEPAAGKPVLERARRIASDSDQQLLAAMAEHNLGYLDTLLGATPEALRWLASAEQRYEALGDAFHVAVVGVDRAALLLQAGLHDEAIAEANRVRGVVVGSGNVLDLAESELTAARAALASGDSGAAIEAADRAEQAFRDSERRAWIPLAQLVRMLALDDAAVSDVVKLGDVLDRHGWTAESTQLRVWAAHRALAAGAPADARRLLEPVGRSRGDLPVVDALAVWTAAALRAVSNGDRATARRAVTTGLDLLASNALAVQAMDLRAYAIDSGRTLSEIGLRLAIEDGRGREFLGRVEALRSALIGGQSGLLGATGELDEHLGALRAIEIERREVVAAGGELGDIDRRRVALESTIRSERRRVTGPARSTQRIDSAIDALDGRDALVFHVVDDELWAVSVSGGRAMLHRIDRDEVDGAQESATFALNRLSRRAASTASRGASIDLLADAGRRLDDALVPDRIRRSGRPVVIVPAGALAGVSWRVLPSMTRRSFAVAPSLTSWAIAASADQRGSGSRLFVAGPDLEHADNEVIALASRLGGVSLGSDSATVRAVTDGLRGAAVAHLACHGSFRLDNPLFSALRVVDGNVTVYDLERCDPLPRTIVMSACDAARNTTLQAGGLLGLSAALVQLGVSSVIAPLTPISDERSVELMVRLHTHLANGVEPAEALALASIGPDGELDPTAAPFICFGS